MDDNGKHTTDDPHARGHLPVSGEFDAANPHADTSAAVSSEADDF